MMNAENAKFLCLITKNRKTFQEFLKIFLNFRKITTAFLKFMKKKHT